MRILFVYPNDHGFLETNPGFAGVITAASRRHDVTLFDATFHADPCSAVKGAVGTARPEIAAFTVNSFTVRLALALAARIKELRPGTRVIFGGIHATLFPEETLRQPQVDAVCVGEGELALPEYLACLEQGLQPRVAGIWCKDRNGVLVRNALRPFEPDLDRLGYPDWKAWEIDRYLSATIYSLPGALKVSASRGCPHACTFCSNAALQTAVPGRQFRARSPEHVVEEILFLARQYGERGFRSVNFIDPVFGADRAWFRRFCELYRGAGLHERFPWDCQTRADLVDDEWAAGAAAAGCAAVSLGIESGSERIRNGVYGKGLSRESIAGAVRHLKAYGILSVFYVMVGGPGESWGTALESLRLVRETRPFRTYFAPYQELPKTALAGRAGGLSRLETALLMTLIRLRESVKMLRDGLRLGKGRFIVDIFRFLFNAGGMRSLALTNIQVRNELSHKTVLRYACERNARRSC